MLRAADPHPSSLDRKPTQQSNNKREGEKEKKNKYKSPSYLIRPKFHEQHATRYRFFFFSFVFSNQYLFFPLWIATKLSNFSKSPFILLFLFFSCCVITLFKKRTTSKVVLFWVWLRCSRTTFSFTQGRC